MKKLVSFIGAGRRLEGEQTTYQKTQYQFPDKDVYETAIFPEALIHRKDLQIGECVLIGTQGSSWGCLIEDAALNDDTLFSLYEELEEQFDRKTLVRETLDRLEKVLTHRWNIPVHCHFHQSEIMEENVLPIFFGYVDALTITPESDILLDITHGFRSMPVLLMASLQMIDAMASLEVNLEVIYGEHNPIGLSQVRYLKPVWEGIRFARAMRFFNERFDAELLGELLKEEWPSGAKAVTRIGNMIQANFFTKFDEALSQLANALNQVPENSDRAMVCMQQLKDLHRHLSSPAHFHERLLALADALAERRLWGQAITTLQLALEAFVFYHFDDTSYGDYDRTKELLTEYSERLHGRNIDYFHRLRNLRNTIAHGGCRSARGGIPQEGNLPRQFKTYRAFLKRVW